MRGEGKELARANMVAGMILLFAVLAVCCYVHVLGGWGQSLYVKAWGPDPLEVVTLPGMTAWLLQGGSLTISIASVVSVVVWLIISVRFIPPAVAIPMHHLGHVALLVWAVFYTSALISPLQVA